MRFLIDENLGSRFARILELHGYNSIFAGDKMRGAADEYLLSFAEKENLILITDDKDFGELVFRFKQPTKGVILTRASTKNPVKLFEMVKDALGKARGKFVVVSEGQIRVRELK